MFKVGRVARRAIALGLSTTVLLAAFSGSVAARDAVNRAFGTAQIAAQGTTDIVGTVKFDVRQSSAGGPVSGYYVFYGAPGNDILRVTAVIEDAWWFHDVNAFDGGGFSGTECLTYADHVACQPFIHVAQDWHNPRFPDFLSWEVPGVSWENYYAVTGEIRVSIAD